LETQQKKFGCKRFCSKDEEEEEEEGGREEDEDEK
jgi:hypothetical protein